MKFINRKNKTASRRGISMIEVVIALAFITIVTSGAITLIQSHTKAELKVQQTFAASTVAENAVECFRFYGDEEKCIKQLKDIYGDDGDNNPVGYTIVNDGCTVTISFSGSNTIEISAVDVNGDEIYSTSYTTP